VVIARLERRLRRLARAQVQFDGGRERARVDRLGDVAAAPRSMSPFFVARHAVSRAGNHNDVARGRVGFQAPRQLETVGARQLHVHQDQTRPEFGQHSSHFRPVPCCADVIAVRREHCPH
jgi:hypothetical protein